MTPRALSHRLGAPISPRRALSRAAACLLSLGAYPATSSTIGDLVGRETSGHATERHLLALVAQARRVCRMARHAKPAVDPRVVREATTVALVALEIIRSRRCAAAKGAA